MLPSERLRFPRGSDAARRPTRGEDGAAAIEMAIVLPLLLLLVLFGIIDMGRLLQQHIQLTEAAREGARLGALNGTVTEVKAKVATVVGPGVTLTYTAAPTVCAAASAVGTDSVVTVQRAFRPATPLMGLITAYGGTAGTITVRATGVMSCVG